MGRKSQVGERDRVLLRRGRDRIVPRHRASDVIEWRQHVAEPVVDGRFRLRARGGAGRRGKPRTKLDGEAMRQSDAGRRRVDDSGLGRKIAGGVGGNRAGHAIVVALHGLIHALGESQVRDGVVGIAQGIWPRVPARSARSAMPTAGQRRPRDRW